jgi:hypothetical protein
MESDGLSVARKRKSALLYGRLLFVKALLRLALVALLLAACQPPRSPSAFTPAPPWSYATLRAMDPADAPHPSQDLIALYVREIDQALQFRLDLLDLTSALDYDLYLALDTGPEGATLLPGGGEADIAWDVLISLPTAGPIQARDAHGQPLAGLKLRLVRDPLLDTLTLSLDPQALQLAGQPFRVQVFAGPPGSATLSDRLGPIRSDAPPPRRAALLLAFWNVFPAYTPAQALRLWDGAHSGSGRSRHGLRYLLNAAEAAHTPIVLLDLKTPTALVALEYLGNLPRLQNLADRGLVVLPDAAPGFIPPPNSGNTLPFIPPAWVLERALLDSRQTGSVFGLPASALIYASIVPENLSPDYQGIFTTRPSITEPSQFEPVSSWQNRLLFSLPASSTNTGSPDPQATADGLSLAARRALIAQATDPYAIANGYVFLGGDLSRAAWGEPEAAARTLTYIAAHPWIDPLAADELLDLTPALENSPTYTATASASLDTPETLLYTSQGVPLPSGLTAAQLHAALLEALQQAPDNLASQQAWQAYQTLMNPSPATPELRAAYLGSIGHLLVAARWAEAPALRADCAADLDWDGLPECILASESFFTLFEADGARLTIAFALTEDGLHQIIAPTSQLFVGLGDPMLWELRRGEAADPGLIPGAFVDSQHTWDIYVPNTSPGQIVFTSQDRLRRKVFTLTDAGLCANYSGFAGNTTIRISLGIDPWSRFDPGWGARYSESPGPGSWAWGITPGPRVAIQTTGALTAQSFRASHPALSAPEDPNFDYPPGHYLPFPLALVEISGEGDISIALEVNSQR